MKKIIISAAVKTLAAVLALIILVFSALTLFAPFKLAKLSRDAGAYNAAASFAIIGYNRSKDINLLSEVTEYCILAKNNNKIIKYAEILAAHSEFESLCEQKDKAAGDNIYASYNQYIYGWYVTALYNKKHTDKAVETAKSVIKDQSDRSLYTPNNAMSYLVIAVYDSKDKATARAILSHLESLHAEMQGDLDMQNRIKGEIDLLSSLLDA